MQSQHRKERPQLRSRDHDVLLVVVENLELTEKPDMHELTVVGIVGANASASRSVVRRAQLGETVPSTLGRLRVLDGAGEQVDDVVVSPEMGEVLECEVDRAHDRAGAAQVTKFIELSLSAGHVVTIRPRADSPLLRR